MKYYLKKPQPLQQKLFFMLLWFTASFGLQAQVCEPISNGGFETNSGTNVFAGWDYYNGASNFSISTDMVHGGTSSMQAANPGTPNTYSLQVLAPAFPTVVGQQYTFKIWIKALNNNTTTVQFSRRDGSGNNENGYMTTGTISSQWTELSYVFTAQYTSTRITLNLGGTTANTYHLDDACVISPTVAPQACTPLANGNFESVSAPNMFTGWSYLNGASNFSISNDMVHGGSSAMQAANPGMTNSFNVQVLAPAFPTVVGLEYTFKIWIKALNNNTNTIQFAKRDGSGGNENGYTTTGTIPSQWTELSYTFTAQYSSTRITINLGGATANTYYLDDACMVEPSIPAPTCLISNGGFEQGSGNTFTDWSIFNVIAGVTVSQETVMVRSGSRAVNVSVGANGNSFQPQLLTPLISVVPGATYKFSVYAKSANSSTASIQMSTNNPSNVQQFSANLPVTINWTQVSAEFVANANQVRFVLNLGANANTYYLDDACLELVCTSTTHVAPAQSPIAAGKTKFLGNIYANHALPESEFIKYFNQVVSENNGKWGSIEGTRDVFNWTNIDIERQFALTNNMPYRFHVLLWGSQQPAWLTGLSDEEQIDEILEWFKGVSEHFSGPNTLEYVEVVNEALNQPPIYAPALTSLNTTLGTTPGPYDWVVNAFKLARSYFPAETKLMINEYRIENESAFTNNYANIIALLKADNLVDVVGMQGHTFSTKRYGSGPFENVTANLAANLQTIADQCLPIMITEFDIEGNSYLNMSGQAIVGGTQAQKDSFQLSEYKRIFGLYWNHPSVVGITLWGWRNGMWQSTSEAYLFDQCTGLPRPALSVYLNDSIRNSNPPLDITCDPGFEVAYTFTIPDSLSPFGLQDPCSCGDTLNVFDDNGSVVLFHDYLLITGAEVGASVNITNTTNFFDAVGNPIPTPIIGTVDEFGQFRIEYYHPASVSATADVTVGNETQSFVGSSCEACLVIIPTMDQWGIILLLLLMSIVSVLVYKTSLIQKLGLTK